MTQISAAAGAQPTSSEYVKDITAQNFMQEVVQASLQVPVLVYFTASWCGPCKQFGPILAKVVNEAKGKLRLARVDIDANPQIAQQFRVQSVPMVFVFFQGQPLDAFQGALPESQLRQMLAQFMGAGEDELQVEALLAEAKKLLAEGQPEEAGRYYTAVLQQDGAQVDALAGLATVHIGLGNLDEAEAVLAQVPAEQASHEAVQSAKAALGLARNAPKPGVLEALEARLKANENDHEARMELAQALFAAARQEEAIDALLVIIRKERDWKEGAARTQLLTFFEALGHTHKLTMQGRRKLSSILFS